MQRCHGKDKAATSATPHHAKGKAAASTMPYHAKDKAATCGAMGPKHVLADENIVQEHLAPPDRIRQRGLDSAKERSSSLVMGFRREMSQKRGEKGDTTSIHQKHNAKEKTCPPDLLRRQTQGIQRPVKSLAGEMSLKQREKVGTGLIPQAHNAKEKTCPPDQLRGQTHGIQRPVKTEARLAGEKKHKTEAHLAGEKKHTKGNASFPAKRTTTLLKARTSSHCSDECTSRPIDTNDHGNTVATPEQREESAAIKIDKEVEYITQKLNKLGVRDDIGFEEYYKCLMNLPSDPSVDTSIRLDDTDLYDMDIRHAVYRIRSYKLSQKESKNELCHDKLKDCPVELLDRDEFPTDFLVKMQYFRFLEEEGVLDWFFHPELCKLACLNDYQRLVPRDHGAVFDWEYADWELYRSYFHSYEMQHEYIEYFETLLRELKWLKDCLPVNDTSPTASKIRTRGIYQATKIATRFPKITTHLVRIGFSDCLTYMGIEARWCNGSDGLHFEIWKRVTQQKESFENALKEVYLLNKCPSRQDSIKYAIEYDHSLMKLEFLHCTASVPKEVSEEKAQELITEKVKKLRIKPKFFDEYIRKKIRIAKAIGLITEV
ncbi:uncharacterized protein LOC119356317 [Triticum dicoccoides]|uniref:uncharacterized protein LOC119356317 n=1 Tax=Triticum dicoccoides TaxID=85692 RepID=UPI000E79C348|nr:uncharacterized protein LOC119356317 [Triticum dicoccoides]